MDKEKKVKVAMFVGILILILASFLIGFELGLIYLAIYFFIIFLFSFLFLIELYLKIQHNIDDQKVFKDYYSFDNKFDEISSDLDRKFEEQKNIQDEFVSFFEDLTKFLEQEPKNNFGVEFKKINENIEISQKQTNAVVSQILELQKDQTQFLKNEIEKLKKND